MPSTSGRAATYPRRADKVKFFNELKDLTDKKRSQMGLTPRSEVYGAKDDTSSNKDNTSDEIKPNSCIDKQN